MQIVVDRSEEDKQEKPPGNDSNQEYIQKLLYGDPQRFARAGASYDFEGTWVEVFDNNFELVTKSQLKARREEEMKKRKPLIDPKIIDGKDIMEIKRIFNKIHDRFIEESFWPINWFEAVAVTWPYTHIVRNVLCAFGLYKVTKEYYIVHIRNQQYTLNICELFTLINQLQGIEKLPNDVTLVYEYGELYAEKKVNIKPKYMLYKNKLYKLSEKVRDWIYVTAVRVPIKIKVGEAGDCKAKGIHPQIWNLYLENDEQWHSLCIGDLRKKHWRYVYKNVEKILQVANFDSAYQFHWYFDEEAEEDGVEEFNVKDLLQFAKEVGFAIPEVRI